MKKNEIGNIVARTSKGYPRKIISNEGEFIRTDIIQEYSSAVQETIHSVLSTMNENEQARKELSALLEELSALDRELE